MARHLLSDLKVRNAKPEAKPYRLADGEGLFLYVPPSGVKSWQFRYKLEGRQQTATLGKVTRVSLAEARRAAERARTQADEGRHVTAERRLERARRAASAKNTFESVSKAWVAVRTRRDRWSARYVVEVENSISNHLGRLKLLPVTEITAALCAPLLAKVERNAPDMERKVRQRLRAILDYAIELGLLQGNPLPNVRRRRLERKHFAATLDPAGIGAILRAAEAADVSRGVRRAHVITVFTAQRIGEVVAAEWSEMDLEQGLWTIPRSRMKRKEEGRGPHVVPLPPVLLKALRDWKLVDGDDATYVCPSPRGETFASREAVEKFYRRGLGLAGKHSPHSWRTVLSTWARDAGKDSDAVEAQLDHVTGTQTQTSYDRAARIERRKELMAWHEEALISARDVNV